MAYFLFLDESGHDHGPSPYEVLAGVAIEDQDLWNLILAVQEAEIRYFGVRYSSGDSELKGKKLLKAKVFRHAGQMAPIDPFEPRQGLARECLQKAGAASKRELTALGQAKLAYVSEVFDICARFRCKAFASIILKNAPVPDSTEYLRKDYAYLFQRFYYYLEDMDPHAQGVIVFDELEKSQSHLLIQQLDSYFKRSANGRQRSGRIIPEPFFVHSDLTTGIQIADLIAYVISWGFRTNQLVEPARAELADFVNQVSRLRFRATREVDGNPYFIIWSFAVITDLRGGGALTGP